VVADPGLVEEVFDLADLFGRNDDHSGHSLPRNQEAQS
jgi:hypothetical protein